MLESWEHKKISTLKEKTAEIFETLKSKYGDTPAILAEMHRKLATDIKGLTEKLGENLVKFEENLCEMPYKVHEKLLKENEKAKKDNGGGSKSQKRSTQKSAAKK